MLGARSRHRGKVLRHQEFFWKMSEDRGERGAECFGGQLDWEPGWMEVRSKNEKKRDRGLRSPEQRSPPTVGRGTEMADVAAAREGRRLQTEADGLRGGPVSPGERPAEPFL